MYTQTTSYFEFPLYCHHPSSVCGTDALSDTLTSRQQARSSEEIMDGYIRKSGTKKIGSQTQIGRREGLKESGTEEGSLVWLEEDTIGLACKL
jgi:hypothetical protein